MASLPHYCEAVENEGRYQSPLAAFCQPSESFPVRAPKTKVHRWPDSRMRWLSDAALRRKFAALAEESSLLHIHGVWETHCAIASGAARRLKRPYVISAHGMLDAWALRQKRLKKTLYARLVENTNLSSAACLRAMTVSEAEQYRSFGLKNPIAVIPNGIEAPPGADPEVFLKKFPQLREKQIVLFMGRIHPKKGVFPLCQAWSRVRSLFPDARLVIAGPDALGINDQLRSIAGGADANEAAVFTGLLDGEMKWSAYAAASLFVLPSYSEGFSIAVLEALSMATPVLISPACYFPEVIGADAGWLTGVTEEEIEAALVNVLRTCGAELRKKGGNGASLVRERFTWPRVAAQTTELYDWLLGGPRPASFPLLDGSVQEAESHEPNASGVIV